MELQHGLLKFPIALNKKKASRPWNILASLALKENKAIYQHKVNLLWLWAHSRQLNAEFGMPFSMALCSAPTHFPSLVTTFHSLQ